MPPSPLRKTVSYDPAARAWCVRIQHDLLDLVVQRGGYTTPEEASTLGDAVIALVLALGLREAIGDRR